MSTILVIAADRAHTFEIMKPTLETAKAKGHNLWIVVENGDVKRLAEKVVGGERIIMAGGWWNPEGKLMIPDGEKIIWKVKPNGAFINSTGWGTSGGAWLELFYHQNIPALEFVEGAHPAIYLHWLETRILTRRYLDELINKGYGWDNHKILWETQAQLWVGMPLGDWFFIPWIADDITKKLAGRAGGRYCLIAASWSTGDKFRERQYELFDILLKFGREYDVKIVYSPHPNTRYTPDCMMPLDIPPEIVVTSSWPGELWGRKIEVIPTVHALANAAFCVQTHAGTYTRLCLAGRKAEWVDNDGEARSQGTGRVSYDELIANGRSVGRQTLPYMIVTGYPWKYRGMDSLESLFRYAGQDTPRGTSEEWQHWMSNMDLFPFDGRVRERIVAALESVM